MKKTIIFIISLLLLFACDQVRVSKNGKVYHNVIDYNEQDSIAIVMEYDNKGEADSLRAIKYDHIFK